MSMLRQVRRHALELREALSQPASGSSLHEYQHNEDENDKPNTHSLAFRLADVITRIWDLGFTAFGGPPVHFGILYGRFVKPIGGRTSWLSEQTYQELFAVCQALPGTASTKMLFCVTYIHAGLVPATVAFLFWSLPGAVGMFSLALGVSRLGDTLPGPVYALLSGLNASTVGIVAFAAVQLATKAVTDPLTRLLVVGSACAGLCYTSLWYFPLLMAVGGLATMLWDIWISRVVGKLRARRRRAPEAHTEATTTIELQPLPKDTQVRSRVAASGSEITLPPTTINTTPAVVSTGYSLSLTASISIIVVFFASFIAVIVTRATLPSPPLPLDLFASMYLAGTIIFGGGPVVIPLLREYVVQPGWVTSRDFLIGLALIQAFPGPNFNFAVYLSVLALSSSNAYSSVLGALLGFIGIFLPGIALALAVQGMWQILRTKPAVISLLRGVNASAVGLVFTAVYRLWQIGYLVPSNAEGESLGLEPWWVAVAAIAYSSHAWFHVPAAFAILGGAVLGLLWYEAVEHH